MANTPGGGGLVVGVTDDGDLIGAELDQEWLRQRVYALTQRLLTVDVSEVRVRGARLLVIVTPTAVEPIRWNNRITWRVGDQCVEVDAATWHARRMHALNDDWSAEESTMAAESVRPQALAVARDFLIDSTEPSARDLAAVSDMQLLRRLGAVTGQGLLTNAGVLAFVGRGNTCVEYVHRDHAGGDSTARVRRVNRSLLEELAEVFQGIDAHNATRHVQSGLVVGQLRDIPRPAAREAVVNGVAHREWGVPDATVVEHVGRVLRVTSPGGFYGGVTSDNIITHPSQSRNRALTQLLADLRVAEREGVGVDRMVREMLRVGHMPPDIREIGGPFVRASLVGDALDESWMEWLAAFTPREETQDVNSLLLLRRLTTSGWVDATTAAPLIQLTVSEARGAIAKLATARVDGRPVLSAVTGGVPDGTEDVWRLAAAALEVLIHKDRGRGLRRAHPGRPEIARSYAAARGRISTTELGALVDASPTNVGGVLKHLEETGELEPAWPSRRGKGFYYRWSGAGTAPDQRPA